MTAFLGLFVFVIGMSSLYVVGYDFQHPRLFAGDWLIGAAFALVCFIMGARWMWRGWRGGI